MSFFRSLVCIGILFSYMGCTDSSQAPSAINKGVDGRNIKIFDLIPNSSSGINFSNEVSETEKFNSVTFDGMLQGAGVAILDANSDGLQDIYFASNMQGDKLYINKGDFKFEDHTNQSGIKAQNWSTGVAVVDINNDGHDDIYVCKFMYDQAQRRKNLFYINNGDGTFTENAAAMGVADSGYSIMANFFDYDKDGDLDLYIANQPPNSLQLKGQLKGKRDFRFTDRLYRNDGAKFTDVTDAAGITNYSYSLSATTIDYNKDGWPDLYVACDYDEADFFYKNNGNGTFTDVSSKTLKHMSNFSMGVDVADINNDGHLDLYVADMVAEDNFRQKTNMSGMNPERFHALARAGYHYQYMFNALQLNNGDATFSEIAQMSGVSNTDWSWTPLFIDLDQDGHKDLIVTNGLMREMRNKDFEKWREKLFKQKLLEAKNAGGQIYLNPMEIVEKAPSVKIANFAYRNNGQLGFEKMNSSWGFDKKTWSQGAAYADFDNDGDLDLVINNMNMQADLYRNMANENKCNNYLSVKLKGPASNRSGINAIVELVTASGVQIYEYTPYRGYMSCSERIAHFGIGGAQSISEVRVLWPDNKLSVVSSPLPNQTLTVDYAAATGTVRRGLNNPKLFRANDALKIVHAENEYDDYKSQILLPYKTSTLGPVLAKGDLDGDGMDDLFVGSSTGASSSVIYNSASGLGKRTTLEGNQYEDGGAAIFDVDGDGDNDIVVASGGSEFTNGSKNYMARLYKNNGGSYKMSLLSAPAVSSSVVLPIDYDADGDADLFIGGRQKPGEYGKPVNSSLLRNDSGKFANVTESVAPFMKEMGMVTSARAADLTGDGNKELIITGEWMGIKVYKTGATLSDVSSSLGLDNTKGWWNTIETADVDGDGDEDLIAGNLGHNIKYKASVAEPFKVYVDDFDKNGTNDVYLGYYENGQCYPVRGRQCSSEQMPFVSEKFASYNDFGLATIEKVLEDHLSPTTITQEAHTFSNTIFWNEGGRLQSEILPAEAQMAPVFGIAVDDFDKDGKLDVFLAGNMYNREVETTRSDAGKGCLISFTEEGMTVKRTSETGLSADKDVRAVSTLKNGSQNLLVIANNNDAVQFFSY